MHARVIFSIITDSLELNSLDCLGEETTQLSLVIGRGMNISEHDWKS